jgi:LacI family transcriptional regulator
MTDTRPKRIALLVETSHGSGRDIVHGVAAYLRERGCDWVVDHETQRLETDPPGWLAHWRGDGVIARLHSQRVARAVRKLRVPVIDVLEGLEPMADVHLVHVDDVAISRMACDHVRGLGLRHVCYVGPAGRVWAAKRRDGFVAAAAAAGLGVDVFEFSRHIALNEPMSDRAARLVKWLGRQPRPFGVMGATDAYAWLAAMAAPAAGLAVPADMAIVGVDNDDVFCSLARPPITSVVTNNVGLGFEAAALLDRLLAAGPRPVNRQEIAITPLGINQRGSSDTVATDDREVASALALIRGRGTDRLSVNDVAEAVGLAPSTLQRRFRAAVGHGVHEEFMRQRVKIASRLLAETDLTLLAVAHRAGFGHQEYLGRVFRSRLGITPAEYRRTARRHAPAAFERLDGPHPAPPRD